MANDGDAKPWILTYLLRAHIYTTFAFASFLVVYLNSVLELHSFTNSGAGIRCGLHKLDGNGVSTNSRVYELRRWWLLLDVTRFNVPSSVDERFREMAYGCLSFRFRGEDEKS